MYEEGIQKKPVIRAYDHLGDRRGRSYWHRQLISSLAGLLKLDRNSVKEFKSHQRKPVLFLLTLSIVLTKDGVIAFGRFQDPGTPQMQCSIPLNQAVMTASQPSLNTQKERQKRSDRVEHQQEMI